MSGQHPDGEERGRTDNEQLLSLLRGLIQTEGLPETAELLGVSARTLQRTTASGRLTVRVRDALALHLLSEESATTNPRDEEADGLAQRLEHLEDRVEALADELRATLDTPPAPVIGGRTGVEAPRGEAPRVAPPPVEVPATGRPWRPYPQLITPDPEPGEELVYGEAMRAIAAWREVRTEYREATRRLDKLDAERRLWELALVLIRDHELTLPPASYPWDQFDRRDEVWGLERALVDLRGERRRAVLLLWLRRVLTLGIWWK